MITEQEKKRICDLATKYHIESHDRGKLIHEQAEEIVRLNNENIALKVELLVFKTKEAMYCITEHEEDEFEWHKCCPYYDKDSKGIDTCIECITKQIEEYPLDREKIKEKLGGKI